ncbi:hypothetical protein H0H87_011122, partial [Tephrocybe sp. NHM501043]
GGDYYSCRVTVEVEEDTDTVVTTTNQPVVEGGVLPIEEAASDVLAEEQDLDTDQVQNGAIETEEQPIDETVAANEVDVRAHTDEPEPAHAEKASEAVVEDKSIAEVAIAIDNEAVSAQEDEAEEPIVQGASESIVKVTESAVVVKETSGPVIEQPAEPSGAVDAEATEPERIVEEVAELVVEESTIDEAAGEQAASTSPA